MTTSKKPPTVASLSAVLAELVERVKEQQAQIVDLQAAQQDQQTLNGYEKQWNNRLAEDIARITTWTNQTDSKVERLQARCDSEFVTGATFQEEMKRQGRALDHAAQQAYLTLQRELRTEWSAKYAMLRSELVHLRGFVEGATAGYAQCHGYLEERVNAISNRVFREGWRDHLRRWRWWVGEHLWRITHRKQWKEAQDNDT